MTTTLHGIRNCDTVRRARAALDARGVPYVFHDFKSQGVTPDQLDRWCDAAGWEGVLNRAGTTFRKLADGDKAGLDREAATRLMLAQPSMIKRPVLEHEGRIVIGFDPSVYEALV